MSQYAVLQGRIQQQLQDLALEYHYSRTGKTSLQ